MFQMDESVMIRISMANLWSRIARNRRLRWMGVFVLSLAMTYLVSGQSSPKKDGAKSVTASKESAVSDEAVEDVGNLFPVSVFTNQVGIGRDPFFPNSTRRVPKVKKSLPIGTAPGKVEAPKGPDLSMFQLKGSFGDVALINGRTIEEGETAAVKTARGGEFTIECLKVTSKSVEIRIQGFPGTHILYVGGKK